MVSESSRRLLLVLSYLSENTDEEHPVTIRELSEYLQSRGVSAGRKTLAEDIAALQEGGYDIVCSRSTQNRYFMATRVLELPELKMLVDAVQAARFISPAKSRQLIRKLATLTSRSRAGELERRLYVDGRAKTTNEKILYTVDLLYGAIQRGRQVSFKYFEYTPEKKKVYKHGGQVYVFSPYDLVWSNDCYYVFGYSESHGQVVKFRVDRMSGPALREDAAVPRPKDYNIEKFCAKTFLMYDAENCTAELLCENEMMKAVIDRFGPKVPTEVVDEEHFRATVEVSASPTFYAWIFAYAGKMRIVSPQSAVDGYRAHLEKAMRNV